MSGKTAQWAGGAVVAAIVLALAAWFLLIGPALDSAWTTRDSAAQARSVNDASRAKLNALARDFARLDEYRSQLATLREQIPAQAELTSYTATIADLAAAHQVTVVGLTVGGGVGGVSGDGASAAPSAAATDDAGSGDTGSGDTGSGDTGSETGEGGSGDGASTATTASASAPAASALAGAVTFQIKVSVLGSYANASAFLDDLQHRPRYLAVSGVTLARQDPSSAQGGMPAVAEGDVLLDVTGLLWVVPDSAGTAGTDGSGTGGGPLPTTERNPFVPVGATG